MAAALREAREEIGLPPDTVEILGTLPGTSPELGQVVANGVTTDGGLVVGSYGHVDDLCDQMIAMACTPTAAGEVFNATTDAVLLNYYPQGPGFRIKPPTAVREEFEAVVAAMAVGMFDLISLMNGITGGFPLNVGTVQSFNKVNAWPGIQCMPVSTPFLTR